MNKVLENLTGVDKLTDQVIASDMLIFAKTGVTTYAKAITEAATPAVRNVLKKQLDEAISYQEQLSSYMMKKGWYNAYDMNAQINADLTQSQYVMEQIKK
ncbi:MAG: spore coat protein [Bacillota bacterium]|nr:spore coat protein [Bacillota bacterium]